MSNKEEKMFEYDFLTAKQEKEIFIIKLVNLALQKYYLAMKNRVKGKISLSDEADFCSSVLTLFKALKNMLSTTTLGNEIVIKTNNGEVKMKEYEYALLLGNELESLLISKKPTKINIVLVCVLFDYLTKFVKDAQIAE